MMPTNLTDMCPLGRCTKTLGCSPLCELKGHRCALRRRDSSVPVQIQPLFYFLLQAFLLSTSRPLWRDEIRKRRKEAILLTCWYIYFVIKALREWVVITTVWWVYSCSCRCGFCCFVLNRLFFTSLWILKHLLSAVDLTKQDKEL